MVDTFRHLRGWLLLLLRLWTLWATLLGVVHKSTGWRPRQFPAAKAATLVDESELDVGVANPPFARLGLLDRHRLADQGLADEDQGAGPFDRAVRAHPAHGAVVRIVGLAQGARIGAVGGAIERPRRGEAQGLVRPLVIVDGAELVEAALLLGERGRRRIGGFRLQGYLTCISLPPKNRVGPGQSEHAYAGLALHRLPRSRSASPRQPVRMALHAKGTEAGSTWPSPNSPF